MMAATIAPEPRIARCRCGQLTLACAGEPVRVSVCHCHDCQRRSGSAFAMQARFPAEQVVITGTCTTWHTIADSGGQSAFHFCSTCGSTLWYQCAYDVDVLAVAVGAFADNTFPPPGYSVYEQRKHAWFMITGDGVEHID